MKLDDFNLLLKDLHEKPGRDQVLKTAFALLDWIGVKPNNSGKEKLLAPKKEELKKFLTRHPVTNQFQLYRITADDEPITVRLAFLKKLRKDQLTQLVDKEGIIHFQGAPPIIQSLPSAPPYVVHIVATPEQDRLFVILNKGDQKRILSFHRRLTQTQFQKIIPLWKGLGAKSKPEVAELFWKSLDLKEINKDFYKKIKEQFDALVGIVKAGGKKVDEEEVKQFAVRLIGRYIFCWFLKEKGIIPDKLLASETIQEHRKDYFQKYLLQLFFNTLNEEVPSRNPFKAEGGLEGLYDSIPYLNGGLFETHPEDRLFKELDLNNWLITFVRVLEDFDFTVDESSTQYQQVAIDPEMLGRIFENLLASQNPETEKMANQRKAFGAFYTPREIVDYMVNQALKSYLEEALLPKDEITVEEEPLVEYKGTLFQDAEPKQTLINFDPAKKAIADQRRKRLQEHIDKFFSPDCTTNPFDKKDTTIVKQKLSEVKVLDPACGSGAFPMGILLRLMELRQIVGHGHRNNYDLKNEILSRNIYGVDIMPMAVEIARLRAWLSLVLETDYRPQDRKNNFGVSALPNLDFKFICANSLIGSGYDEFASLLDSKNATSTSLLKLDSIIKRLEEIRNAYFDPKGDKKRKENLQKEFQKLQDHISTDFESIKKNWNLDEFFKKVGDWNPFDDSHPSTFFSPAWMFGIKDGFDVVIGNPPWGAELSKIEKARLKEAFEEIDSSTPNSFSYFIGLGNRLSKSFCFVLPDSVLIKDFEKTRRLIGPRITNIQWYQNTGVPEELRPFVFVEHDVTVINCGVKEREELDIDLFIYMDRSIIKQSHTVYKSDIFLDQFNYVFNLMLNEKERKILNILNSHPVISYLEVHEGIHTGNSRELLFTKDCQGENCKDLFYGGSVGDIIDNYHSKTSGWKVKYNKNIIDKDRGYYASLRNERIFKEPKIYITRTGNPFKAFYDECTYASNNFFSLQFKNERDNYDDNLKFILPFIVSSLCQYFIRKFAAPRLGNTFVETKIIHLLKFTIPNLHPKTKSHIVKLVNQVISKKDVGERSEDIEQQLEILVFKAYGFLYADVKVVVPDFWMAQQEYENFKIEV